MTALTVDFEIAFWSARSGLKQTILLLFSFYSDFYSIMRFKENHYLTREFHVKLHLKTDITVIASRYVRYRFSRNEFSY